MKIRERKKLRFRSVKVELSPERTELMAAHDFKRQQQSRVPGLTSKEHKEKYYRLLPEARKHLKHVFPDAELPTEMQLRAVYRATALDTNFDDPLVMSKLNELRDRIETAARDLELPLHSGLSVGGLASDEVAAMQQRVMMTDASVVLITEHFLLLLHRLSKLLALSTPIAHSAGDTFLPSVELDAFKAAYLEDANLKKSWMDFFIDYSLHPTAPPRGPAYVLAGSIKPTLSDMYEQAMETFVVAHEYAHHIAKHSLGGIATAEGADQDSQHLQELEADMIAAHICMKISDSPADFNMYLISNVGACTILKILELIRQGTAILEGKHCIVGATRRDHPPLAQRLSAIRLMTREMVSAGTFETLASLQAMYCDFLDFIWLHASEEIKKLHAQGVRPPSIGSPQWFPM